MERFESSVYISAIFELDFPQLNIDFKSRKSIKLNFLKAWLSYYLKELVPKDFVALGLIVKLEKMELCLVFLLFLK